MMNVAMVSGFSCPITFHTTLRYTAMPLSLSSTLATVTVIVNSCSHFKGASKRTLSDPKNSILGILTMSTMSNHSLEKYARSEEHTSELQSLMRNSYAVFCLKKKKKKNKHNQPTNTRNNS